MSWKHDNTGVHDTIRKLDHKAGQFLERITFGSYTPEYSAESQEIMAIEQISRSARRRNRQIAQNFTATYQEVIQELNYLNFLDENYSHLTPAEKEALHARKKELVALLRESTAHANASLYLLPAE